MSLRNIIMGVSTPEQAPSYPEGAFDLSTAVYVTSSGILANPYDVMLNDDGSKFYTMDGGNDRILEYSLPTPFDISSTPSLIGTFSVAVEASAPYGFHIAKGGGNLYVVGITSDQVHEYLLNTAWDVTSGLYNESTNTSIDATPSHTFMREDGTKLYVIGYTADSVDQLDLVSPFSLSDASVTKSFSTSAEGHGTPMGLWFSDNGQYMFYFNYDDDTLYRYTLSTPWEVDTAVASGSLYVGDHASAPRGLYFTPDGLKLYICCSATRKIHQYQLGV